VLHRVGNLPEGAEIARFRHSMAPVFRIMLAREMGDRYRRIIYMDSDMSAEGGDLNRLMEVDLGPHPIAAVLDVFFFYKADFRAQEYILTGLPAMPYANTGFQVIDTRAYREQDLERRSFDVCRLHPNAILTGDQSLTNLALKGKFAQLAPCWNWQLTPMLPFLSTRYPVFIHHFIGKSKPNLSAVGSQPVRFNQSYRDFMTQFGLEELRDLAPTPDPAPMGLRALMKLVFTHVQASRVFSEAISRFPDPYRARI
jgi:lipopolysaccharide biosynthesis glycosyltransferase